MKNFNKFLNFNKKNRLFFYLYYRFIYCYYYRYINIIDIVK